MHWLLEDLQILGGYYKCPEDSRGNLLGPLVGYAGKYTADDGSLKQYVGKEYFNFARGEQDPIFRNGCAHELRDILAKHILHLQYVIGLPMGGIMLAVELGKKLTCQTIFAEKSVTKPADNGQREESRLVIERHELKSGSTVILIEDVCNNFSTTTEAIRLVKGKGCKVAAIACAINRSAFDYTTTNEGRFNVVSVLHQPSQQWRQDDPEVAEHVRSGNVVWKPKHEWERLKAAMDACQA